MILRFWFEKFDPRLIIDSGVLDLLKKYSIGICFASTRGNYNENLAKLVRIMNENKLRFCLWPLLPDELGYWISTYNASAFINELNIIFDWASKHDIKIDEVAIDLEIPIYFHDKIKRISNWNPLLLLRSMYRFGKKYYDDGISKLGEARDIIHEHGAKTLVPIADLLLDFDADNARKLGIAFGNPIFDIKWDILSPMIYNSMYNGYFKIPLKLLRYRQYQLLIKERKIFGNNRSGVSLGVLWTGKLGNEPMYHNPQDIAIDVSIAKAAGINDITIYNLEGIIYRRNREEWISAIINSKPQKPCGGEYMYYGYKFLIGNLNRLGFILS